MAIEEDRIRNVNLQENIEADPQVLATSETGNEVKITRRHFLELATASTAAATLAGCGSSQTDRNAIATEVAADIFATQTAEATAPREATQIPTSKASPTRKKDTPTPAQPTDTPVTQPTTNTSAISETPRGTIKFKNVSLRAGPGTKYDQITDVLAIGSLLYILAQSESGSWWKVKTEEGNKGWIRKINVEVDAKFESVLASVPIEGEVTSSPTSTPTPETPQTGIPQATVKFTNITLRAGPGVAYDTVGEALITGTILYILAQSGSWWKIKTEEGKIGYIRKIHVKVEPGFESLLEAVPQAYDIPAVPTPKALPAVEPRPTPRPLPTPEPPSEPSFGHYWYPN